MWIQLLTCKSISKAGKITHYHPGDWVNVGKHDAMLWIGDGSARMVEGVRYDPQELALDQCGVLLRDGDDTAIKTRYPSLDIERGAYALPFPYTAILDTATAVHPELIAIGFDIIRRGWQVAAVILSYDTLASDVGEPWEREELQAVIHDLRVPLYNPHVVFMRRSDDTRAIVDDWREYAAAGWCDELALLRALWNHTPLLCPLPTVWTGDA